MNALTAEDKKWRAENDARVLAEAKVIASDTERLAAARTAAQEMADQQAKEASAMRSVARSKNNAPARAQGPQKKKANARNSFNVMERIG